MNEENEREQWGAWEVAVKLSLQQGLPTYCRRFENTSQRSPYVFGLWEETRGPGGNPQSTGNMQIPCTQREIGFFWPKVSHRAPYFLTIKSFIHDHRQSKKASMAKILTFYLLHRFTINELKVHLRFTLSFILHNSGQNIRQASNSKLINYSLNIKILKLIYNKRWALAPSCVVVSPSLCLYVVPC